MNNKNREVDKSREQNKETEILKSHIKLILFLHQVPHTISTFLMSYDHLTEEEEKLRFGYKEVTWYASTKPPMDCFSPVVFSTIDPLKSGSKKVIPHSKNMMKGYLLSMEKPRVVTLVI